MRIPSFGIRPLRRLPLFWAAAFGGMAVLLAAVAFMQFRATRQIGKATEDRIAGDLESVMIDWHLDFYRRFSEACVAIQVGPDSGAFDAWDAFRDRYAQF